MILGLISLSLLPYRHLSQVCATVKTPVIGQHVDFSKPGSTTGFLVPEIVKSYGAVGSLINHSEHRIDNIDSIRELVEYIKKTCKWSRLSVLERLRKQEQLRTLILIS